MDHPISGNMMENKRFLHKGNRCGGPATGEGISVDAEITKRLSKRELSKARTGGSVYG